MNDKSIRPERELAQFIAENYTLKEEIKGAKIYALKQNQSQISLALISDVKIKWTDNY